MKKDSISSTIQRTLKIIELFLSNPDGLTPQEILDETKISRSTLFSLLKSLKELGYLNQNEARGRYLPGNRLISWSGNTLPSFQTLLNAFQQETYQQDFDETIALAVPTPNGIITLAQVESNQKIRAVYTIGEPLPLSSAAQQVFKNSGSKLIKQQGFALVSLKDEYELAFPICQDGINTTAFLLLNAPSYRWVPETLSNKWQDPLRFMAARLSYRLGALSYTPFQYQQQTDLRKTASLDKNQIDQFLQGPWAARLACIRPDGNPHVIPVWQEWDGENFYILAWQGSQWADFIRKNPQVSLTIDEPWQPLRRIVARGEAKALPDDNQDLKTALLSRLTKRYLGQSAPILFEQQVDTIFRIKPDSIKGWTGILGVSG